MHQKWSKCDTLSKVSKFSEQGVKRLQVSRSDQLNVWSLMYSLLYTLIITPPLLTGCFKFHD